MRRWQPPATRWRCWDSARRGGKLNDSTSIPISTSSPSSRRAKSRVPEHLDWLAAAAAYAFQNTADGYKVLYEDGIFCEYAVFEPRELARFRSRGGASSGMAPDSTRRRPRRAPALRANIRLNSTRRSADQSLRRAGARSAGRDNGGFPADLGLRPRSHRPARALCRADHPRSAIRSPTNAASNGAFPPSPINCPTSCRAMIATSIRRGRFAFWTRISRSTQRLRRGFSNCATAEFRREG